VVTVIAAVLLYPRRGQGVLGASESGRKLDNCLSEGVGYGAVIGAGVGAGTGALLGKLFSHSAQGG
jgi:hypothetical protein